MPATRRLACLTLAVLLGGGALLAGCSKDTTTISGPIATTPALAKESLVARANEICAAADKAITELADTAPINNSNSPSAQDELRQVVAKITPIAQNAIYELQSLTPPAGDAALVTDGFARMQRALDAVKDDPSNQLNPIGMPDEALYQYGLRSCFTRG